jgi:hypothetical protein
VTAEALRGVDVVLIAPTAARARTARFALLDLAGKAYRAPAMASALAMNKAMSKRVFVQAGIQTPRWLLPGRARRRDRRERGRRISAGGEAERIGSGSIVRRLRPDEALGSPRTRVRDAMLSTSRRELTAVLGDQPPPIVESGRERLYDYSRSTRRGRASTARPTRGGCRTR